MGDLGKFGRSELHHAALEDATARLSELLDRGVPYGPDKDGNTPLHLAAQEYALGAAIFLLGRGTDVDPKNKWGNTPLFVATFHSSGRGEMISLLLRKGADPMSRTTLVKLRSA